MTFVCPACSVLYISSPVFPFAIPIALAVVLIPLLSVYMYVVCVVSASVMCLAMFFLFTAKYHSKYMKYHTVMTRRKIE